MHEMNLEKVVFVFFLVLRLCQCSPVKKTKEKDCSYDFCNVLGSDICQNGGTCASDGCNVKCYCTFYYEGKHCELRKEGLQRQSPLSTQGNGNFLSLLKALVSEDNGNGNSDDEQNGPINSNNDNGDHTNGENGTIEKLNGYDGNSVKRKKTNTMREAANEVNILTNRTRITARSKNIADIGLPNTTVDNINISSRFKLKNSFKVNPENNRPNSSESINNEGTFSKKSETKQEITKDNPTMTKLPSLPTVLPTLSSESLVYPPRPEIHPNATRNIAPDWDVIRRRPWQRSTSQRLLRSLPPTPMFPQSLPAEIEGGQDNTRWTVSSIEPLSFLENPMNVFRNLALAMGKQNGKIKVQPNGYEDVKNGRQSKYFKLEEDEEENTSNKTEKEKNIMPLLHNNRTLKYGSGHVNETKAEYSVNSIIREFIFNLSSPIRNIAVSSHSEIPQNLGPMKAQQEMKSDSKIIRNNEYAADAKTVSEYDSLNDEPSVFTMNTSVNETSVNANTSFDTTVHPTLPSVNEKEAVLTADVGQHRNKNIHNTEEPEVTTIQPLLPVAFSVQSVTKESMIQDTSFVENLDNSIVPEANLMGEKTFGVVDESASDILHRHLDRKNTIYRNKFVSPSFVGPVHDSSIYEQTDNNILPIDWDNQNVWGSPGEVFHNQLDSLEKILPVQTWNREQITSTYNQIERTLNGLIPLQTYEKQFKHSKPKTSTDLPKNVQDKDDIDFVYNRDNMLFTKVLTTPNPNFKKKWRVKLI